MSTAEHPTAEAVALALSTAEDFESLVRPLLQALEAASGYESTYFSLIDWDDEKQELAYVYNAGELQIPESARIDWSETLCRNVLLGGPGMVEDVAVTYPDNEGARGLNLHGWTSVPVTLPDGSTIGTLCGASQARVAVDSARRDMFAMFSVIIGQALAREQLIADERARTVAAEDRLRSRLESIAVAEHMLKTPLTVLQGWSAMFARKGDALSAEQRSAGIDAIAHSTEGLRELVDRLLEATRADYRLDSTVHLRTMDVAPLLASVVTPHQEAAGDQDWTVAVTGPLVARIDPPSFEQLIGHLLDNAIKYGGPGAQIHVEATAGADDAVTIVISDTGLGMPAGLALYEPFARARDDNRTDSVGIGLHVVKSLADAHRASIAFTETEPHGTTVTLGFPAP